MKAIDILIILLEKYKSDTNIQAICLQNYISTYGPIPDSYGDQVKQLLNN